MARPRKRFEQTVTASLPCTLTKPTCHCHARLGLGGNAPSRCRRPPESINSLHVVISPRRAFCCQGCLRHYTGVVIWGLP